MTSLRTNAFRTTSFTEIAQHIAAFRQSLREPLQDARGNEGAFEVRDESEGETAFDGNDDFSDDGSEVVRR